MEKIIDLIDSDDEASNVPIPEKRTKVEIMAESTSTVNAAASSPAHNKIQLKEKDSPPLESKELSSSSATGLPTKSTLASPESTSGPNSTNTSPSSSNANKSNRHRSRKTPHQTIRISPDMQFETISLDDEDQTPAPPSTVEEAPAASIPPLQTKPASKVRTYLKKQPATGSRESIIKSMVGRFTERPETTALIRKIAADRVRVNYLMNAFNLPEINFSQSTHIEMLRFQLRDRLKQRRIRILTEELQQQVRTRQVQQLQQEKDELEHRIQNQLNDSFAQIQ